MTVRSGVSAGEPNVLPLPSGTSLAHPGYLVFRAYLPAGQLSHLTPPTLTWAQGSTSRTLPACSTRVPLPTPEKAPAGATPSPSKTAPPAGAFFTPAITTYRGALADKNDAYVWAYVIRPAPTDVLVVRAKAPTFPAGSGPSPWPAPREDMQYWSMCIGVGQGTVPTVVNQLPGGHVDYGCRADEATTINAAGDYNYVIGSEAQRAAISKIPAPPSSPSRALKRRLRGVRGPSTSCCCATSSSAPASLIRRKRSLSRLTASGRGSHGARTTRVCRFVPSPTLTTKGLSVCGTH